MLAGTGTAAMAREPNPPLSLRGAANCASRKARDERAIPLVPDRYPFVLFGAYPPVWAVVIRSFLAL